VAVELSREEGAMVGAHRDYRHRGLQHLRGQGAPAMAADIDAARAEVVRDDGIDRAHAIVRPGGRHQDRMTVAEHVPESVLGRQAAKNVSGADEQDLSHGRSLSHAAGTGG
jgi:hypothetical protein